MEKRLVLETTRDRVLIMDSISSVGTEDEGSVIVSASHGGKSSGEFAIRVPLAAVFFNDAGVGKDAAGTEALRMLEVRQVPAATVAHTSARIGDARDTWDNGVISHVNPTAQALGAALGQSVQQAVAQILSNNRPWGQHSTADR